MPILTANAQATENIKVAGRIIDGIFKRIEKMDLRRMKTLDLNDRIDTMIREKGASPAFLNYRGFPKSCCISLNSEVVHGIPDSRRIEIGDIVKIDVGVKYRGYIADAARTFPVGNIASEVLEMLEVTKQALRNGINAAQPGNKISDISRAIQTTVEEKGYSVVRELTGHGVGAHLHEEPAIPNFVSGGPEFPIKAGMALAIEPMVNMGKHEVFTAQNRWTVMTRDDSLSCHFEDTILILEAGNLNLTKIAEN
ncbi:MAG: type I methionyl aminopeptidase [candidate division WOR-3 bacterium]|nr:MAG: type I methionyl aminopeptidase [candidate division WOR-3 bacterium]